MGYKSLPVRGPGGSVVCYTQVSQRQLLVGGFFRLPTADEARLEVPDNVPVALLVTATLSPDALLLLLALAGDALGRADTGLRGTCPEAAAALLRLLTAADTGRCRPAGLLAPLASPDTNSS